jgi:ketosteroid isomerase-like protein
MSGQNVELHRRLMEALNAHDVDAFIALNDPRIEFHTAMTTVYRGHDELRGWFRNLEDAWGVELRAEPEAYFDLGEHTLTFYVSHGRGRQSGAKVEAPGAVAVRWRDGLAVYWKNYSQREDALNDLGVSEDVLEPLAP